MKGQALLDQVRPVVDSRGCTFINSVTQVSDDHVTPVDKLWITFEDDDGTVRVYNHAEDPWEHSNLTTVTPEEAEIVNAAYNDQIIDRMVDIVIKRRLEDYTRTADFDDVLAHTRRAVINGLALTTAAGHNREHAVSTAGARACEAFDRAFHLARISAAGINLDDHPEYRSYQIFFDLKMPPPTHAQMADHIIAALAPPQ